jgi:hypothetical protein
MESHQPPESGTDLVESAAQTMSAAAAAVQESVASLPDFIGRYPLPSLLVGIGLGYLLLPSRSTRWRPESSWSQTLGDTWHAAQDTLAQAGHGLAQNVSESASTIADQAQTLATSSAQRARDATTALGQRLGPTMRESVEALPALGQRYPVVTLVLTAGLAYWLGARSRA